MALSLGRVVSGTPVRAAELNQIIDFLEGASGENMALLLRAAAASDVKIVLADAAGVREFQILDSAEATVFSVDSDGNVSVTGTLTVNPLVFPTAASPAQTTLGSVVLDSDDFRVTVGDGTTRRNIAFDDKGADIASAAALTLTAGYSYFHVTGTTTITSLSSRPAGEIVTLEFDGTLTVTHNATSLILTGSANVTTAAGTVIVFVSEGSGNWREVARNTGPAFESLRDTFHGGAGQSLFYAGVLPVNLAAAANIGIGASFGNGGSGVTTTAASLVPAVYGMSVLSTGTLNASYALLAAHLKQDMSNSPTDFDISTTILLTNDTSRTVLFGLKPNDNGTDENNSIVFRVVDNGNIIGVCDAAGVETARDSGFAGSASPGTKYHLRIVRTGNTVKFFINNAQVGTDVTTNIPVAGGISGTVVLSIANSAAADKRLPYSDFMGKITR